MQAQYWFEPCPPHTPWPLPLFLSLPPEWPPRPPPNITPLLWCYPSEFLGPCPPLLSQCPQWDPQSPPPSNFCFRDGSMASLETLMYLITESRLCPCTGACDRVQDLVQSPLERKRSYISVPSATKGMRKFFKRAAPDISPSLSMIQSCGSIPWLNIVSHPPPLSIGLSPIPCPSDFRRPSSFFAERSTHTGVEVNHSPLYTFFWIPLDSNRDHDFTSSMSVVLI